MMIKNFFDTNHKVMYEALVQNVYDEVQEQFEGILQLDEFPELFVDTAYDTDHSHLKAWLGTTISFKEGDTPIVKAITPDSLIVAAVPFHVYLMQLGFQNMLDEFQFQAVVKEYVRMHIIYQLIIAHDMKFEYDRFIGADGLTRRKDIMKPLLDRIDTGHYYKAVDNFYMEKLPENKMGLLLNNLEGDIMDYVKKNGNIEHIDKSASVVPVVWEVVLEAKSVYQGA